MRHVRTTPLHNLTREALGVLPGMVVMRVAGREVVGCTSQSILGLLGSLVLPAVVAFAAPLEPNVLISVKPPALLDITSRGAILEHVGPEAQAAGLRRSLYHFFHPFIIFFTSLIPFHHLVFSFQ